MGSLYTLHLVINDVPKGPNQMGWGKWVRTNESKKWHKLVGQTLLFHDKPKEPLKTAKAAFLRCAPGTPMDCDNLAGSFKYVRDALVKNGIIIDDKPAVLKAEYHQRKSKRKDKRIEVVVFEPNNEVGEPEQKALSK